MIETWASGSIELLNHADERIKLNKAFDKRIAFICIDCAVETAFRTYINLPESKRKIKIPYKEIDEAGNSFPKLTELAFRYANNKLYGVESTDIEYYHRIRNELYHNGTGLSVDDKALRAYREIANIILQNLFEINVPDPTDNISLENLILLWNIIQQTIIRKLDQNNISNSDTYKWEVAEKYNVLSKSIIRKNSELAIIRNFIIHNNTTDNSYTKLQYGIELANEILHELKSTY